MFSVSHGPHSMSTPMHFLPRLALAIAVITLVGCHDNHKPAAPTAPVPSATKPQDARESGVETEAPLSTATNTADAKSDTPPPPAGPQSPVGRDAARREAMEKFKSANQSPNPPQR